MCTYLHKELLHNIFDGYFVLKLMRFKQIFPLLSLLSQSTHEVFGKCLVGAQLICANLIKKGSIRNPVHGWTFFQKSLPLLAGVPSSLTPNCFSFPCNLEYCITILAIAHLVCIAGCVSSWWFSRCNFASVQHQVLSQGSWRQRGHNQWWRGWLSRPRRR